MVDTPRISLVASVALAAGLAVGCVCPGKRLPIRGAGGPTAALSIAGVVRDEQGRPIPSVWIEVEGHPKPFQTPPAWRTDVHGRFQIDDIPPGPVKLLVTPGDLYSNGAKTKVVETRTGVRDLVIVLDPGPQLFLRIVGYVPGEQTRWARVTWVEHDGERQVLQVPEVRYAPIRADGWVRFVALPPDREFEMWALAEIERRHVWARGLKPGQTEQRVERQEVKDIAGTIRGPVRRTQDVNVTVDVYAPAPRGAFSEQLRVARVRPEGDGSFRVRGLPPGTYSVNVGSRSGQVYSVSKSVEAGTSDAIFDLD